MLGCKSSKINLDPNVNLFSNGFKILFYDILKVIILNLISIIIRAIAILFLSIVILFYLFNQLGYK